MNLKDFASAQKAIECLICEVRVPEKPKLYRIGWLGAHVAIEHYFTGQRSAADCLWYMNLLKINLE